MRIALYVEDGLEQIVLTPETDIERHLLRKLREPVARVVEVKGGSFYACRGGWTRQGLDQDSTIIVMRRPAREAAPLVDMEGQPVDLSGIMS